MAIANYHVNGKLIQTKHFEVPKRAGELKYWYKAAAKAIRELPPFEERFLKGADITVETIILEWFTQGINHRLYIARKRRLL